MTDYVKLSPDLGWSDFTKMLDPSLNPAALSVDFALFTGTTNPVRAIVGPEYPVIRINGSNYLMPADTLNSMLGDGMTFVCALFSGDVLSAGPYTFIFCRNI